MAITHPPNTVYDLPNTSIEHDRLNTQARLTRKITGNRVIHAPLITYAIRQVLDIGCGPGVVTREFSDLFPTAQVTGVDITLLPALFGSPPPNVQFLEGDIMDLADTHASLKYDTMDYAFSRYLVYALTCWPEYIEVVHSLLKPGAWAEIQDGRLKTFSRRTRQPANLGWENMLHDADRSMGLDPDIGIKLEALFQGTGFVNVKAWEYEVPLSTWEGMDPAMREVGAFYEKAMPGLLEGLMRLRMAGRVGNEKIEEYVRQMKTDLGSGEGYYINFYVVVGQRKE